jgi:hypothetical protein
MIQALYFFRNQLNSVQSSIFSAQSFSIGVLGSTAEDVSVLGIISMVRIVMMNYVLRYSCIVLQSRVANVFVYRYEYLLISPSIIYDCPEINST